MSAAQSILRGIMEAFNGGWPSVKAYLYQCYMSFMLWWQSLPINTRNYVMLAACMHAAFIYYFYYSGRSYRGYEYMDDDYSYSSYSSYGQMSWTTWAAIMFGAYKVPPMFPAIFGDYARPFFGMNMTTFMWLLNSLTSRGKYLYTLYFTFYT